MNPIAAAASGSSPESVRKSETSTVSAAITIVAERTFELTLLSAASLK